MCCVFCFMPAFCFRVRFRMSRCASVGAHPTVTMCAMCVYKIFGALTRLLLCCRRSPRLFNMVAQSVERVLGLFSFQHPGKSRVTVCSPVFNCRNAMRDRPLCRTLWSVESSIARERNLGRCLGHVCSLFEQRVRFCCGLDRCQE